MATPTQGNVFCRTVDAGGGLFYLEADWAANSSGFAVYQIPDAVEGMIERVESRHYANGAVASYAVALYDDYGADWLNGLCASLTGNTYTTTAIFATGATTAAIPILMMGYQQLYIAASAGDYGNLRIHMRAA